MLLIVVIVVVIWSCHNSLKLSHLIVFLILFMILFVVLFLTSNCIRIIVKIYTPKACHCLGAGTPLPYLLAS